MKKEMAMTTEILPGVPRGTLGVFMQDDSCHWYFVPVEQTRAFSEAVDAVQAAEDEVNKHCFLCGEFDKNYGKYRVGSYPGGYVVAWQNEERP